MIAMPLQQVATVTGAELQDGAAALEVTRVVTDSRTVRQGDLFVAIRGERFDGHTFLAEAARRGAVACLCERRILPVLRQDKNHDHGTALLFVDDTVEALGRLATHYRRHVIQRSTTVLAVTGSNGKTTVKQMIHHVLSARFDGRCAPRSFNNNIGVPLTLFSTEPEDRYLVVEIGSNAPGEVAELAHMAAPDVGIISSVGEAHLAGLGSVESVAAEKATLLDHLAPGGLAIVNLDSAELTGELRRRNPMAFVTVGRSAEAKYRVEEVIGTLSETVCTVSGVGRIRIPIPGLHHATNAAAAAAAALHVGMELDDIIARLESFSAPSGRACASRIGDVTVIDDTYNANPTSVSAAIRTLAQADCARRVFVLGDMLELGDESASLHRRVVREMANARIDLLLAVGRKASQAAGEVKNEGMPMTVITCDTALTAGGMLTRLLAPGDAVWVKGSRATELERVVEGIRARESDHKLARCVSQAIGSGLTGKG